jgi:hypothetical protein
MRRRVWRTMLLLLAFTLLRGSGARADQRSPFGVVAGPGDLANDPNSQNLLSQLGVGWVRAAWTWDLVEVAQDNFQWQQPDRMVADLAARGIWIYWDFSYAPCWANGRPCQPGAYGPGTYATVASDRYYPPTAQADLYNYVFTVVSHYKQLGYTNIVWGGWNEVDGGFYNVPGDHVTHYVNNALPTIVNAIRTADPLARIAIGELSTSAVDHHNWLKQILDKVTGQFQYIALHVYGAESGAGSCNVRVGRVDSFRTDVASWGYGAAPIWVTETGGGLSDFGGSVAGQTAFMQCFWGSMQSRPWWTKAFWYNFQPPTDGSQTGLLDGTVNTPYAPNARYTGFQNAIASLPISFTNGSFELGIGADAQNWVEASGHTRTQDNVIDGGWAMKSTYTGPGVASYQLVNVQPTESGQAPTCYVFSAWIYKKNAQGYAYLDLGDIPSEPELVASSVNQWQFLSRVWCNTQSYSSVLIRLVTAQLTDAVWFDGVSLKEIDNGGIELNGSFESGTGSDAYGWTEAVGHGRSADRSVNGSYSLKSTNNGPGAASYTCLFVQPNTMYRLSGYIYNGATVGTAYLDLSDIPDEPTAPISHIRNAWEYVHDYWYSGAANSTCIRLVTQGSPDGPIYFDAVHLTPVPQLVANPSFESGTGGNAATWAEAPVHARNSERSKSGSWSLKSTQTSGGNATWEGISLGSPCYKVSGWIYRGSTGGGGNAYLDMNDIAGELSLFSSAFDTWQFVQGYWCNGLTGSATRVPSLTLRCVTELANNPTWFDDVTFVPY